MRANEIPPTRFEHGERFALEPLGERQGGSRYLKILREKELVVEVQRRIGMEESGLAELEYTDELH